MNFKRMSVAGIVLALFSAVLVSIAPQASAATASRAMWVNWVGIDGALGNATATTTFTDMAATVNSRAIKRVYVYMNLNGSGQLDTNTVNNLRYFRNGGSWPAGLQLWGAGGGTSSDWVDPAQYKAAALTSKLRGAALTAGGTTVGLFQGVMLDIEPLQLGTWTGAGTDGGVTVTDAERQTFLTVASDSYTEAHVTSGGYPAWQLTVTLTLNIQYYNMLCSSGNTFSWELAVRVNEITVMAFRDVAADIETLASSMMANLDTVTTYIGVQRYTNTRLSVETDDVSPANITFYNSTLASLHSAMDAVTTYFSTSPNNRPKFSSGAAPFGYDINTWALAYRYYS